VPLPNGAIARLGVPKKYQRNLGSLMVAFLPDGRTAATAGPSKTLRFWEARTGKQIRSLEGYLKFALSPDGKTLATKTGEFETVLCLFDMPTQREIGQVSGGQQFSFCFSPDGRQLAFGGGTTNSRFHDPPLRVWDVATAKPVQECPLRKLLSALCFSPDGKLLVTGKQQNLPPFVQVWDVSTGKEVQHFLPEPGPFAPSAVRMSPDGKLLASGGSHLYVWRLAKGEELWRNIGLIDGVTDIAFSPNGQTMAVGTLEKGALLLFETGTGRLRARFDGGVPHVHSIAFSNCGLMLASVGWDEAALVWDVTGAILGAKDGPALAPNELAAQWADLGGEDAAKAWTAIRTLTVHPKQAVPLLKDRLGDRKSRLSPKGLARLLADLDSDDFPTRQEASGHIAQLGPAATPVLKKYLAATPSLEGKRRAEELLVQICKSGLVSEEALAARCCEVLEYIGTSEAKELLAAEATGEPVSELAKHARAALQRLEKRPASP